MASDFNFNIEPGTDIPTSQASLAIRRKLAAALLQQGTDTSPVRAWTQGAARVAQGLLGGFGLGQADLEEANARKQAIADWTAGVNASGGPQPSAAVAPTLASLAPAGSPAGAPPPARSPSPMPPAPVGPMPQVRQAMEGVEPVPQDAYAQDTFRTPLDSMRPPRDAMVAALTGSPPTPAAPPPMPPAENVPAMPVAPPASSSAPAAPLQGGNRPIDPRLMRALGNEFLPQGMAQLASGQIGRQLAPPEFKQIGQTILGQPQYGWVNAENQTVKPIDASGGAAASGAMSENVYAQLPKPQQMIVDNMLAGRQPLPSSFALKTPYWNQLIAAANEKAAANGTVFDATTWTQRNKTARDFATGGPSGNRLNALDQVQQHIEKLSNDIERLDNGDYPLITGAKNFIANQTGLNPARRDAVQSVNDDIKAVTDEMARAYKGGHVSDSEIRSWNELISNLDAKQKARRALSDFTELLGGARRTLVNQHQEIMGAPPKGTNPAETERINKIVHDRLLGLEDKGATLDATPAAPITKTIGNKTYIKQNGQWFEQ